MSVMDLLYQGGICTTASCDGNHPSTFRIDYSDETLNTLNESDLNEPAGVGSTLHPNDIVEYCGVGFGCSLTGPASGPIDWNNDGNTTDLHAQADIDNDDATIRNFPLQGFNDWAYIHQQLQRPPESDGSGEQ
jgi:hypothetical protein